MSKTLQLIDSLLSEIRSPEHSYLKAKGWDYDQTNGEYFHAKSNHVILYHRGTAKHHVGGGKFGKVKTIAVGTAQQAHHMALNA